MVLSSPPVPPGRTPDAAFRDAIVRFEGAPILSAGRIVGRTYWQELTRDLGNWVTLPDGTRRKLGTMYGVTPAALATHLNRPVQSITRDEMRALTLDTAVAIGLANFFRAPGLDRLPWSPLVEAVADFGWGSGPQRAIRVLQRCAGAVEDGVIGPATVAAVTAWIERAGLAAATDALADARIAFYRAIPAHISNDGKFTPVWIARAQWFRPANAAWWWHDATPSPTPAVPDAAKATLPEAPKPAPQRLAEVAAEGDRAQKLIQIGGLIGTGTAGAASLLQAVPPWASGILVLVAGGLLVWGAYTARHALRRILAAL